MRERGKNRRGRWVDIGVGYLAAVVAADVIFLTLIQLDWPVPRLNDIVGRMLVGLLVTVPTTIVILLPAAAFIWQGERHQVRSWLFYAAMGALVNAVVMGIFIALLAWQYYQRGDALRWPHLSMMDWVLIFLPGLSAGLVYWGVAGRNAGRDIRLE